MAGSATKSGRKKKLSSGGVRKRAFERRLLQLRSRSWSGLLDKLYSNGRTKTNHATREVLSDSSKKMFNSGERASGNTPLVARLRCGRPAADAHDLVLTRPDARPARSSMVGIRRFPSLYISLVSAPCRLPRSLLYSPEAERHEGVLLLVPEKWCIPWKCSRCSSATCTFRTIKRREPCKSRPPYLYLHSLQQHAPP